MGKADKSRRAFLVGAAVGAGAVAGTTMVTGALAQHRQHPKTTEAPDASHGHDGGKGHGAFFNDDDAATVAAFAERLMPGAPGKPGARDAGVLNYIDLALAGAYADQQDFYRRGLAAARRPLPQDLQPALRPARRGAAGRSDRRAGAGQGGRVHLSHRAGVLQHGAHAHHGGHVRRPDLWRQQGLRRLAAGGLPRRAAVVHRRRTCRASKPSRARPSSACKRRPRPRRGRHEPWQPKRPMSSSSAWARSAAFSRPSSARPA